MRRERHPVPALVNKHNAWWALGERGYTEDIDSAQRFAEAQAVNRVVRSAGCGDRTKVTLMVAAPENWVPRDELNALHAAMASADLRVVAGPGPLREVLPEALGLSPEDHPDPLVTGPGETDGAATPSAAGVPAPAIGAPAQDPDAPPYASPFAYRAEARWSG